MTSVRVRKLGLQDYETVYQRMTEFTATRDEQTEDELWFLQHPKVFTQGQAGKAEHVLSLIDIVFPQSYFVALLSLFFSNLSFAFWQTPREIKQTGYLAPKDTQTYCP